MGWGITKEDQEDDKVKVYVAMADDVRNFKASGWFVNVSRIGETAGASAELVASVEAFLRDIVKVDRAGPGESECVLTLIVAAVCQPRPYPPLNAIEATEGMSTSSRWTPQIRESEKRRASNRSGSRTSWTAPSGVIRSQSAPPFSPPASGSKGCSHIVPESVQRRSTYRGR